MATVKLSERRVSRRVSSRKRTQQSDSEGDRLARRDEQSNQPWYRSTFSQAVASGLLLWAAFPPLGLWPLGWVAAIFWIGLIGRAKLAGKRPYVKIWAAGFIHWMLLFHFIRLPHWAGYFGWVALSLYLGGYLVAFVGLSRIAVHRLKVPLIVAAPVVWVGLELFRGHFLTGLSMSLIGHTQVELPLVIQIADLFGAYAVSFLLVLAAACLFRMLPVGGRRWTLWPAAVMLVAVSATLAYGRFRLDETIPEAASKPAARVLLIQGSKDTLFDLSLEEFLERRAETFEQYCEVTAAAREAHPDVDLIMWPESKFPFPDLPEHFKKVNRDRGGNVMADPQTTKGQPDADARHKYQQAFRELLDEAKAVDRGDHSADVHFLGGTETAVANGVRPNQRDRYNTALLVGPDGEVAGRYFKMHRVPFGEYVFFGDVFPWVYNLTPMPSGLTPGQKPEVFEVAGVRIAPNICFETTVPHHIRGQIRDLKADGKAPDVLANITDDGWFKGSSCLDHHLACSVFRAVENRIPVIVAANTGFSAWIDGSGRVLEVGPRHQTGFIYAEVTGDGRSSLYQATGDVFAGVCLLFCVACLVVGVTAQLRQRKRRKVFNSTGETGPQGE